MTGTDYLMGKIKTMNNKLDKVIDGAPLVLVDEGKLLQQRMARANVDFGDIMESAQMTQRLETLEQIKYAVLEKDRSISIIPNREVLRTFVKAAFYTVVIQKWSTCLQGKKDRLKLLRRPFCL
jgi:uncharacterized membrane protein YcaP (DUF421 family)